MACRTLTLALLLVVGGPLAWAVKPPALRTTMAGSARFAIESEYLPRVIGCEHGADDVPQRALEMQAVMARTYLYNHLFQLQSDIEVAPLLRREEPPTKAELAEAIERGIEAARSAMFSYSAGVGEGYQDLYCGTRNAWSIAAPYNNCAANFQLSRVEARKQANKLLRADGTYWCSSRTLETWSEHFALTRQSDQQEVAALTHCVHPLTGQIMQYMHGISTEAMQCLRQHRYRQAARNTRGAYIAWYDSEIGDSTIITANYRDGTSARAVPRANAADDVAACSDRVADVTINRGKVGGDVARAAGGGGFRSNRGRASQHAVTCLVGYHTRTTGTPPSLKTIASFFFGEDIELLEALPTSVTIDAGTERWPHDPYCSDGRGDEYYVPRERSVFSCHQGQVGYYERCTASRPSSGTLGCIWSVREGRVGKGETPGGEPAIEDLPRGGCSVAAAPNNAPLLLMVLLWVRRRSGR